MALHSPAVAARPTASPSTVPPSASHGRRRSARRDEDATARHNCEADACLGECRLPRRHEREEHRAGPRLPPAARASAHPTTRPSRTSVPDLPSPDAVNPFATSRQETVRLTAAQPPQSYADPLIGAGAVARRARA